LTPIRTQLYKKSYGFELLRIAQGDLESACALQEVGKGRRENIGYLAQQCIEKSIKSVLCFRMVPVPHSHELSALITLLSKDLAFPYGLEISDLSHFASIRRYMEGSYELDDEEILVAIEVAKNVYQWAIGIVK